MQQQKGFTHVLFFIILASMVVGGLFYYSWQKGLIYVRQNQENSSPINRTGTHLANWKIYRNDKLGFEFKYPSRWRIYDFDNDKKYVETSAFWYVKRLTISSPDYKKTYSGGDFGTYYTSGAQLNFAVHKNSYKTLEQILEQESLHGNIEKIKVDNIDTIKTTDKVSTHPSEAHLVATIPSQPNPVYISLSMSYDPNRKQEAQDLFDKILSTLKFIN